MNKSYRKSCNACPRKCGDSNYCGVPFDGVVARSGLHFGEEPCISGKLGSGTIFFAGCNLGCVFCQNYAISFQPKLADFRTMNAQELADTFKRLEDLGAHNINLVTPSHYTSIILSACRLYRPSVPLVYNTSSYERVENIEQLSEYVSIWLPDVKFFSTELSARLCNAPDYFDVASLAIRAMRNATPLDTFGRDGVMRTGMIVRHLILPSHVDDSQQILNFVSSLDPVPRLSLMSQYVPMGNALHHKDIARRLTSFEYSKVLAYANSLHLDGFTQERTSATENYVPIWGQYI